ncbi:DUF1514 family protein [Staphylococcus epidermidis]|nr:DUF1514 family protein [Staphylococcus epidermidis]
MWIILSIMLAIALLISLCVQSELRVKVNEYKYYNELLSRQIKYFEDNKK